MIRGAAGVDRLPMPVAPGALRSLVTHLTRQFAPAAAPDQLRALTCAAVSNRSPYRSRRPRPAAPDGAPQGGAPDSPQQPPFAERMEGAKAYALKLLSSRSHSRKELTAKMLEREHLEDAIDGALDRLEEVELQSDAEFAEVFARSKWRQAKWGPSRIKAELSRRGVEAGLVQAALQEVFGAEGLDMRRWMEEQADEALDHVAMMLPEAALMQAARDQFSRTSGLTTEARRRRLAGWLQRRGHAWADVSRIMKRIEGERGVAAAGEDHS